jgi:hypothetical protein
MFKRRCIALLVLFAVVVAGLPVAPVAASSLQILGLVCYTSGMPSPTQDTLTCYTQAGGGTYSYTYYWSGSKSTSVTPYPSNDSMAEGVCTIGRPAEVSVMVVDSSYASASATTSVNCGAVE